MRTDKYLDRTRGFMTCAFKNPETTTGKRGGQAATEFYALLLPSTPHASKVNVDYLHDHPL